MNFRSIIDYVPDKGEIISSDSIVEPGLSMPLRSVVRAFTVGGNINCSVNKPVYDDDSVCDSPDVQASVFDGHDVDLTDLDDAQNYLVSLGKQREQIQSLAVQYSQGKLSFDDFCSKSNSINPEFARSYIKHFGEMLSKNREQANRNTGRDEQA